MSIKSVYTSDKSALEVFRRAFPSTNYRSIAVSEFRGPMSLNSYWSDGYRDYFAIVPLVPGAGPEKTIAQNGTPYDGKDYSLSELPEGSAIAVNHYRGARTCGELFLNAANLTPMLPGPVDDLPWTEQAVLVVTAGLKSFARREELRRMSVTTEEIDAAITGLKAKRLLAAGGGITPDGRNRANSLHEGIQCDYRTFAEAAGRKYVW